jgi:hypothetical protein
MFIKKGRTVEINVENRSHEWIYIIKMLELQKGRLGEVRIMDSLTLCDKIFDGHQCIHKYDATCENCYLYFNELLIVAIAQDTAAERATWSNRFNAIEG